MTTACRTTESVDNIHSNNMFQQLVATTSPRAGHQIQNLLSSLFGLRSFAMFTFYKVWVESQSKMQKSTCACVADSGPKQGGQRVWNRPV